CRRSACPDGPELAAMLGIARIDTVNTDGLDDYRQPEPEPVTADDVAARERAREPFVRNVADDTSDARDGLGWLERRFGLGHKHAAALRIGVGRAASGGWIVD